MIDKSLLTFDLTLALLKLLAWVMVSIQFLSSSFIRFLFGGGIATALHWGVMWALVLLQVDATVATGMGALAGAIANYLLQYYHTFNCVYAHSQVFPAYLRTCIIGWVVNATLFHLIITLILSNILWAQLITTGWVTFLNYYLYKKVVFHERCYA